MQIPIYGKRIGKNITVKYQDDEGQPISGVADVILTGNVGEDYTTDKKIFLATLSKKFKVTLLEISQTSLKKSCMSMSVLMLLLLP